MTNGIQHAFVDLKLFDEALVGFDNVPPVMQKVMKLSRKEKFWASLSHLDLTMAKASTRFMLFSFMTKEMVTVADRLMPILQ